MIGFLLGVASTLLVVVSMFAIAIVVMDYNARQENRRWLEEERKKSESSKVSEEE